MTPSYPGELYNIEFYFPSTGGNFIYRFDSKHPSTTPLGAAQDQGVGIEYMGDDHKTVWLSFPLYYLDTADARKLVRYVINSQTQPVFRAKLHQSRTSWIRIIPTRSPI
jgi:hypothetical protein